MTDREIEQLKEWIKQLKWKSVDRDNMEFEVRMTCYVRDAMMKFSSSNHKTRIGEENEKGEESNEGFCN